MPVTKAPAITVPAMTWYGEAGSCRDPELRVSVEPDFWKASFWSCRFCAVVASALPACADVEIGPAAIGSKPARLLGVVLVAAGAAAGDEAAAPRCPPLRKNTDAAAA